MTGWIVVPGDRGGSVSSATLRSGVLLVVLGGLPARAGVLLDLPVLRPAVPLPEAGFWPEPVVPSGFSLFAGREHGITLRHRRGGLVASHCLPGPLPEGAGPLLLRFSWTGGGETAAAGRWQLDLGRAVGGMPQVTARGAGALAPEAESLRALCQPGGARYASPALGAVAVRRRTGGPVPEDPGPGALISANALVAVPGGQVPVGALRAGSAVFDIAGRLLRLAALHLVEVPPGLPFSPLRLRAGRLPMARDLLAGPRTPLAFAGDQVAGMFGTPRVLVTADQLPQPLQRPLATPLRSVLMALAVPERPAILTIGELPVACLGPDATLPPDWTSLGSAAAAALLGEPGASWWVPAPAVASGAA